jgi:hypothetical protein
MTMSDENGPQACGVSYRRRDDALQLGPRKKAYVLNSLPDSPRILHSKASCLSDPLIGHGRHFGRTVHALCNIQALLANGILRLGERADKQEEVYTSEYV